MSRPIFEPTEQRQIAALGFDKNQLQRRPRPSAALTLPWAMLRDGATTVPFNGTNFPVPYQVATKNYDPNDTYFSWTITDAGDPGTDRFVLTLKREGIYLLDGAIAWTDTGSGNGTVLYELNPSNSYNPFGSTDEKFAAEIGGDWNTTANSGDIQASAIQRVYCLYSANTNCTLTPTVTLSLASGNRGLSGVYLKAVYLQAHGDEDDWVVENV